MEIAVTTTPARLAGGLGVLEADLLSPAASVLWVGIVENVGPETVYLRRSVTAPDPAADIGSRVVAGGRRPIREYSAGAPYGGPWWAWTARSASTLLAEEGSLP